MKIMKNITIISLIALLSCGRDADVLDAPKSYNEQVISLRAFFNAATEMQREVRAMTLLFYPRVEQAQGFSYRPLSADAQNSWSSSLSTLPYGDRVVQNYSLDMNPELKVQKLVAAIQAIGRSRDNAWRKMWPLEVRMKTIEDEKTELNEQKKELEPDLNWRNFTCFYEKRPRRGSNYDCRVAKEGAFSKRKRPRSCKDFLSFNFTYNDDQGESQTSFESAKTSCTAIAPQLEQIELLITALNQEFDELNEKFEPLSSIRQSGEGIVLDLLQTAERHTLAIGSPEVYVATGSTIEKPNNQNILSEVVINWETKEVEVFKLFIEFGLNYSGGVNSLEYSIANGRIQEMKLEFVDGNPKAVFKLVTDDFWIECDLDITNDDPAMGYRMTGEVFAHYPDNSKTRGGMRLEFNAK